MASQPIYQLYAELCDYKPKMWRRFQTLNNISMAIVMKTAWSQPNSRWIKYAVSQVYNRSRGSFEVFFLKDWICKNDSFLEATDNIKGTPDAGMQITFMKNHTYI